MPDNCTYLNFTASHDGIGVRPLQGIIPDDELNRLAERMKELGGHVSTKTNSDGSESPYEINITYFDALGDDPGQVTDLHIARFLCSQTVAMELRGVPAVYFHSLVGTPNDTERLAATGQARAINRHKYTVDELTAVLSDPTSRQARIFAGYRRMLAIRIGQPAFHPGGRQQPLGVDAPSVLAFVRTSPGAGLDAGLGAGLDAGLDAGQRIAVLANCSNRRLTVRLPLGSGPLEGRDLLGEETVTLPGVSLAPWQCRWVELGAANRFE